MTILKSLVLDLKVESSPWPCELSPCELSPRDSSCWKNSRTLFTNHCMFCTNDFKGYNLEFCPLPITE